MGNQQAKFPLPEDIITQILLLLPLHSLLACKCVSKQWRDHIKNPRFVKLYEPKRTALFLHKGSLYSLLITDHDYKKMKPRCVPIGRLNSRRRTDWGLHSLLVGSSNKRACVKTDNGAFLVYDLVTGDSYEVGPLQEWPSCWYMSYGFGYDPYTDDYKIVVLLSCRVPGFVYSFGDGGWKSFKGFPDASYYWESSSLGYCFNGVLHCLVEKSLLYDDSHGVVATMDLHSGGLAEIALPWAVAHEHGQGQSLTLGELDGHLCCCCCRYGGFGRFDVWAMKEYEVEESWTKLLSISDQSLILRNVPVGFLWTTPRVICSIDGGAKVAICVFRYSNLCVLEYDLCEEGTIRVIHKTTWVKDKI